jgi:hypothetical protein
VDDEEIRSTRKTVVAAIEDEEKMKEKKVNGK